MKTVTQQLRRFTARGILLREVRAIRQELGRIATAFEQYNAHQWPQQVQPDPDQPPVEVSYVDTDYQREMVDIEMRLTQAKGVPPTDEEILAEFIRRYPDSNIAQELGGS